ncbi:hypothetical protein D5086_002333 [Populus alba]|uniref:Uncharacterized protein n=1 Tax=Populus alba TaxID=43335 RepID=A0ACC4D2I1_POPAL
MGAKRQRMVDQGPSFYGNSPGSSFMYNTPPYGYVSQPPPPFPVVRLRGLPFDCTETDVAEFFRGLDIVDVLFVHKGGKFTGEAFCVLGYPLQVDFALQKNRQNMGRRYVEVFRSKRQDYYKAIANEVSESRGSPRRNISRAKSYDEGKDLAEHTGVLRLRGLPFSAGKDDIMEFFKDFVLSEDSIHITMNSEGRPTGEAFVEFANAEDSKAAMAKDRMTLGSRYIELFPSSIEELDEARVTSLVFKAFDTTFEEDWFKGGFLRKYRCYFEGLKTILPECDWLFQNGVDCAICWNMATSIAFTCTHFSAVILDFHCFISCEKTCLFTDNEQRTRLNNFSLVHFTDSAFCIQVPLACDPDREQ